MQHSIALFLVFNFFVSFSQTNKDVQTIAPKISAEELKLYNSIMSYRKSKNLPVIPLSKSLTHVAQVHCRDLNDNKPDLKKGCNAHSWSDKGTWSSCCYTPDNKQSKCMWSKPGELTNYKDNGFEIACGDSDPRYQDFVMSADYALDAWKKSYHHNNVIINKDIWKNTTWNAIGIGIYNGFATVLFGKTIDSEGEPEMPVK